MGRKVFVYYECLLNYGGYLDNILCCMYLFYKDLVYIVCCFY